MQIDPEIAALRGNRAAQRRLHEAESAAVGECRRDSALAPVLAALQDYGDGAVLGDCLPLDALFRTAGAAKAVMAPLVARLVALHRDQPLAQLAFRHRSEGGFHFLQIAAKGRATLGLALHDRAAHRVGGGIASFPDAERHEAVLAGAAELGLLEITEEGEGDATIVERPLRVGPDIALAYPGCRHSRIVRRVDGRLLVLRLARIPEVPLPTRQFALPSGHLLHRASGDRRESRHEMMVALLGRMGRIDAAPAIAALTASGSEHFRWQALRECLALDTAEGFRALTAMAGDPADSLARQAQALRAQLVEAHPQLAALGDIACRA